MPPPSMALRRGVGVWRQTTPRAASFDNAALRELPVDAETQNFVRRVAGACWARVTPAPIARPELVLAAPDALALVGIDVWESEVDATADSCAQQELAPIDALTPHLAGNKLFAGAQTAAQCYCGHQFGVFAGQLGDGAATYLGEVVTPQRGRWEMQLKGAGPTPFSRSADGRKVLRSSLREFLASEHMHALGIPTTRAGSVVMSRDTTVKRDMFYDGHTKDEPTAVVLRIARTFLRFGSFEIFKPSDATTGRAGPSAHLPNKADMMRKMLDFTIRQYFSDIWARDVSEKDKYVEFYTEVVRRTARLVAKWQCVGFCHGVLNTDNMSIVGDTLDYGPFGFMEHFNLDHVSNTSDDTGRYRYRAQPEICKWNCKVLADQLALVVDRDALEHAAIVFDEVFQEEYYATMRQKLGFLHKTLDSDRDIVDSLVNALTQTGADFTCTFRALLGVHAFKEDANEAVVDALLSVSESLDAVKKHHNRFSDDQFQFANALLQRNPLQARMYGVTPELVEAMAEEIKIRASLDQQNEADRHRNMRKVWQEWVNRYAERLRLESDNTPDVAHEMHRRHVMRRTNPVFILRNHVAQRAIDFAMAGQYDQVAHIYSLLSHPFEESEPCDLVYARPPAPGSPSFCVSCSS